MAKRVELTKWRRLTLPQKAVRLLAVLLLVLALGNVIRLFGAVVGQITMPDLPMSVSWVYLALMGILWAPLFVVCAAGLSDFRSWSRVSTLVTVSIYELHVWVNHLLFDRSDYAELTRTWDLLATFLLLAIVWGLLSLRSIRAIWS